jgi:hypothetical protein
MVSSAVGLRNVAAMKNGLLFPSHWSNEGCPFHAAYAAISLHAISPTYGSQPLSLLLGFGEVDK